MPDQIFSNPRLAAIYDELDPNRGDLTHYLAVADEFDARSVLDVGCGTGTFACMLADRGLDVTGVDPAAASLDVARAKSGADRVRWLFGDATDLPPMDVDLVTMTGNVAQVFLEDDDWLATLGGIRAALGPAGRYVFEVRDPARRAWQQWTRDRSFARRDLATAGVVESWVELTDVSLPFVSFRWTYRFASDGETVTSDSTLRFREREEVEATLSQTRFRVLDVREAPDRPGKEFVFVTSPSAFEMT